MRESMVDTKNDFFDKQIKYNFSSGKKVNSGDFPCSGQRKQTGK